MSESDGNQCWFQLSTIGNEADPSESEKHHCPCRWFGDARRDGGAKGKARISALIDKAETVATRQTCVERKQIALLTGTDVVGECVGGTEKVSVKKGFRVRANRKDVRNCGCKPVRLLS